MRLHRRLPFALLSAAFLAAPAGAGGQATTPTTAPTVAETQSFSLNVPGPPQAAPRTPVAVPNRSLAEPEAAPLPQRLAYTGTNPLPLIAAGLAVVLLSLGARRWSRTRLRADGGR